MLTSYYKSGLKAVYELGRFLKESTIARLFDQPSAQDADPTFTITKILRDEGILSEQMHRTLGRQLADSGIADEELIKLAAKAALDAAYGRDGDAAALGEAAIIQFGKKALDYGIAVEDINLTVEFFRTFTDPAVTTDIVQFAVEKAVLDEALVAEAFAFQLITNISESLDDSVSSSELARLYIARPVSDEASGSDSLVYFKQSYVSERYFLTDYVA